MNVSQTQLNKNKYIFKLQRRLSVWMAWSIALLVFSGGFSHLFSADFVVSQSYEDFEVQSLNCWTNSSTYLKTSFSFV